MAEPVAEKGQKTTTRSGRRQNMILGGILVAVMLIEGVVIFVLAKHYTGGPQEAAAQGPGGLDRGSGERAVQEVEVEVCRVRAQNDRTQRLIIYDVTVFATVSEHDRRRFSRVLESKQATIQDRLGGVIRAAAPERFMEPELTSLRQRFRQVLSDIAGDEIEIIEVLIPSIVAYTDG